MKTIFLRNNQLAIWNVIKIADDMPRTHASYTAISVFVNVSTVQDINGFTIHHENKTVPDFIGEWCPIKKHFRIYIATWERSVAEKKRASHSILVIGTRLEAAQFLDFYGFICRNRANNRDGQ